MKEIFALVQSTSFSVPSCGSVLGSYVCTSVGTTFRDIRRISQGGQKNWDNLLLLCFMYIPPPGGGYLLYENHVRQPSKCKFLFWYFTTKLRCLLFGAVAIHRGCSGRRSHLPFDVWFFLLENPKLICCFATSTCHCMLSDAATVNSFHWVSTMCSAWVVSAQL
jgi:hypothetical protein